jgi:hypothetical protein
MNKILFVYYQNIKQGGISKSLANLVNNLSEENHDIEILFLMRKHDDFYPINPSVKKIYINSFDTKTFRFTKVIKKIPLIPKKYLNSISNYLYD